MLAVISLVLWLQLALGTPLETNTTVSISSDGIEFRNFRLGGDDVLESILQSHLGCFRLFVVHLQTTLLDLYLGVIICVVSNSLVASFPCFLLDRSSPASDLALIALFTMKTKSTLIKNFRMISHNNNLQFPTLIM